MGDISYTRTGIIKKVGEKALMIEMADTGESIVWPLHDSHDSHDNDEDCDICGTLEVGEEVTLQMHISDDPFLSSSEDEEEAEHMRKLLEELLN